MSTLPYAPDGGTEGPSKSKDRVRIQNAQPQSNRLGQTRHSLRPNLDIEKSKQKPFLMLCGVLCGVFLAIGHHLYYTALNGKIVTSTGHQEWSIRVGTAFAFITVSLFKMSVAIAYIQLLWHALRKKAFAINDIDSFFNIGSDITAFTSYKIYSMISMAIPVAIILWVLPIAAIFPPATLSVSLRENSYQVEQSLPQISWLPGPWFCGVDNVGCVSGEVLKIAGETAQAGEILTLYSPAPNSSYNLKFFGPSLACSGANETQQAALHYYSQQSALQRTAFTLSLINGTLFESLLAGNDSNPDIRFFSAFSPPFSSSPGQYSPLLNNWNPELGPDAYPNGIINGSLMNPAAAELWVQLFDQTIVCELTDAEFDIVVQFKQGAQSVKINEVTSRGPFLYDFMASDPLVLIRGGAYTTVFNAFTNMVIGNLTMNLDASLIEVTSEIMTTSLLDCPEMNLTAWKEAIDATMPWQLIKPDLQNQRANNYSVAFPTSPSNCRNGSLARALEDLANNVTISMLSSPSLTTNTTGLVSILRDVLVYEYNSFNLLVSYGAAAFVSLIAIISGFYAIRKNGVFHSSRFSSIVLATRNPTLDQIFRGGSVAAMPLPKKIFQHKLRYGLLLNPGSPLQNDDRHIAFGTVEETEILR